MADLPTCSWTLPNMLEFLAQTTQPGVAKPEPPGMLTWLPLVAMLLIFWFIVFRPRSQEQKKFKDMLSKLKKGDRVMTIGGIIGTVINIKDDEVTLKVDESTNTKVTFTRGAIKSVLGGNGSAKPSV